MSRYSQDECIEAIRRVADHLGHAPSYDEYRTRHYPSEPSLTAIRNAYGTWSAAKEDADMAIQRPTSYETDDHATALRQCAYTLMEVPTVGEYTEWRDDSHPSYSSIIREYGSWTDARKELDVDDQDHIETQWAACEASLERVRDVLGESPSVAQYIERRRDDEPTRYTIASLMGSWNATKRAMGFSVTTYSFDAADCLDALLRVADDLDRSPSISDYRYERRSGEPAAKTIATHFEDWNAAKDAAGLETYDPDPTLDGQFVDNWKEIATEIRDRDGRQCLQCGMSHDDHVAEYGFSLDVHHLHKQMLFIDDVDDEIIERVEAGREIHDGVKAYLHDKFERSNHSSNLVTLCRDCHLSTFEDQPVEWQVEKLGVEMPTVEPDVWWVEYDD